MDASHVREDVRSFLSSDVKTRIEVVHRDLWVDYRSSEAIFHMMSNISCVPERLNSPALLVIGPGGSGKSTIISQIPRRVKNSDGLIFISMAENPEISFKKSLREELAIALGVPQSFRSSSRSSLDVPNEIREVIRLRKIWGVVIDELHDALLRSKHEQRIHMSILKRLLSPEYGLKLFCFGTLSAKQALASNDEFKRRFHEISLEDWKENDDFRSFLLEVEQSLPLKRPSRLYSEEMVKAILALTFGRMDKTIDLIRSAACHAIKSGVEFIDVDMIGRAAKNPWGY